MPHSNKKLPGNRVDDIEAARSRMSSNNSPYIGGNHEQGGPQIQSERKSDTERMSMPQVFLNESPEGSFIDLN